MPLADLSRHSQHDKNGKLIVKKRGRPRAEDVGAPSKRSQENHVKKLRKEFGLTGAQVSKVLFVQQKISSCIFLNGV